jgi:hypothetical protein
MMIEAYKRMETLCMMTREQFELLKASFSGHTTTQSGEKQSVSDSCSMYFDTVYYKPCHASN